jgi:hypothetical protein
VPATCFSDSADYILEQTSGRPQILRPGSDQKQVYTGTHMRRFEIDSGGKFARFQSAGFGVLEIAETKERSR